MKLKFKMTAAFLAFGLIPFSAIGLAMLYLSSGELEQNAFQKLTAVREIKKTTIQDYFHSVRDQAVSMSEDLMIIDATKSLGDAFHNFRKSQEMGSLFSKAGDKKGKSPEEMRADLLAFYTNEFAGEFKKRTAGRAVDVKKILDQLDEDAIALQYNYIRKNKFPLGEKQKLDTAGDVSKYSQLHARYHPPIRSFLERFGYYDIFLVDHKTGDVIYSVFKKIDFGTSLLDGPFADTNLGEAFRKARELSKPGGFVFTDFKPYLPAFDAPASFIAAPVFDKGQKVGIVMFQVPLGRITAVMSQREGLGRTGESYLVGPKGLMRSDSFLDPARHSVTASFSNPDEGRVDTEAAKSALAGNSGTITTTSYTGRRVLSAFSPVDILGTRWALLADTDLDEAFAGKTRMWELMGILGLIGIVLIAIGGFLIARGLSNPVVAMTASMRRLADGDTAIAIDALGRKDEIGEMAEALEVFKTNAVTKGRMETDQQAAEAALAAQKERAAVELKGFMDKIGGVIESVSSAVTQLGASSKSMNDVANDTRTRTRAAVEGSNQASENVQMVAQAAKELSNSIVEIRNQVLQSSQIANRAVESARETDANIQGLAQRASKIGEVVELITGIAEQTNLLALNATIEAARAGEAGRGFAVVASEVKELASQTSKATEEIGSQISEIQAATKDAVKAIAAIGDVIAEIDQVSSGISAAVEEQGSATDEIARAIDNAAAGSEDAAANISTVNESTDITGETARQIVDASDELTRQADNMKAEVDKFLKALIADAADPGHGDGSEDLRQTA